MAKNNGDIPAAKRGERGKQVKYSDSDLELVRSATSEGMTAPQIINRYQDRGWRLRAVRRWVGVIMCGDKEAPGAGARAVGPERLSITGQSSWWQESQSWAGVQGSINNFFLCLSWKRSIVVLFVLHFYSHSTH